MLTSRRLTLLLAAVLLAAACSTGPDTGAGDRQPPRGVKRGTLRIVNHADVETLDPGYAYATVEWALLRGVVRELYSFDSRVRGEQAMTPVPDLADGPPKLTDEGRTYTFGLRKGVRYAPPLSREVRAEDFVYAVQRQLDPDHDRSPNPYSSLIQGAAEFAAGKAETISGMQALDDFTLRITLKRPASDFLSILTLPFFSPVPKEHADDYKPRTDYAQHLAASGPYTVQSYDPGRRIELERNQNWDPRTDPLRKAWVDNISVTIRPSQAGIQQTIERGEQDLNLDNVPPPNADLQRLSADRDLSDRLAVETTGCVHYLTLQMDSGATSKLKVRQAVNYAIDRQAVVAAIGGRYAGEPASTILSPTLAGYSAFDLYPSQDSRGDPDAAKRLLVDAGYPDGVRLTYVGQSTAPWKALYSALEVSLARAGIRLAPKFIKRDVIYAKSLQLQSKKHDRQLGAARWCPDYPGNGSRSFIGVLLDGRKITPTANNNYGNYDNPRVNEMIDKAYATADEPARNAVWGQVDRVLMEDAAWAPLVYDREAFFWSARVRNWTYTPWLNNPDITNLWLDPNTP
jgi:peptide/nickel transport system substrate-binding protein